MSAHSMICGRCGIPLMERQVQFIYLEHRFTHGLLACPECGQVYLDEELVKGKMLEMEKVFEEK